MKSWGDLHSDDESMEADLDEAQEEEAYENPHHEEVDHEEGQGYHNEEEVQEVSAPPPTQKVFEWPTEAPFTAYVGNLAYSIEESSQLADEIVNLARQHLGVEVVVVNSRLAKSRNDQHQRHRGFGYIELETLEQLKAVVEGLGGAKISGRPIQLDTANQSYNAGGRKPQYNNYRGGGGGGGDDNQKEFVDGSKFRGGKYNNRRGEDNNNNSNEGDAPQQRSTLKLQPRSNKGGRGDDKGAASNIFGEGRARDDLNWRERKKTDPVPGKPAEHQQQQPRTDRRGPKEGGVANNNTHNNFNNNRHGSTGRGNAGRGRGGGGGRRENTGRGSGTGGAFKPDEKKDASSTPSSWRGGGSSAPAKPEGKKSTAAPSTIKPAEKPVDKPVEKPAVVVNRFAALALAGDSDSD